MVLSVELWIIFSLHLKSDWDTAPWPLVLYIYGDDILQDIDSAGYKSVVYLPSDYNRTLQTYCPDNIVFGLDIKSTIVKTNV